MKTYNINKLYMTLIVISALFIHFSSSSQTPDFTETISINQDILTTNEIYPFSQNMMYGLSIDGNITLFNDSSIVKIILRDSLSLDYMIYETNAYLSPLASFTFSGECEETCFMEGFIPTSIEIQILNANVFISSLSYASMYVEEANVLQQQFKESKILEKIDLMNAYIQREGLIWNAGKTSYLSMYYNDKKELFESSIWNPAFEYYVSGFFGLRSPQNGANITVNYDYVDNFDWRNRHGANDPNSSYYDGDPHGSGWLTSPACQSGCWINGVLDCSVHHDDCTGPGHEWRGAATCWAFGPTSHVEALVNLYLNQHYDVNLAEQEIVSCSYDQPNINQGSPRKAYDYFKQNGVVDENCFLYTAQADACEDCCNTPLERIKINDYIIKNSSSLSQEELRETIMNDGPVSAAGMNIIWGPWPHSMQLVGWDIIKWGDENIMGIPPNPAVFKDYVGCTYWIYKENAGDRTGVHGFIYAIHTNDDTPSLGVVPTNTTNFITSVVGNFDEDDIACVDNDLDGYFYWGIGPKPQTCCPSAPDEPDGDDNNPGLGPLNEHGFCRIINTYNSGFEKTMNYWKQRDDDDCDWMRYYGQAPIWPITGPNGTPDGSEYYIYMDASYCNLNKGAYIESPPIDLSYACGIEMTFAYHKKTHTWGNDDTDDSKLSLDISYDEGQTWVNDYWYVMRNHGDQWHYVTVYLPAQVNKVRFYAYVGCINWFNDIALDDITIGPTSNSDIVIETDEIWNNQNYYICNNIVIEPNATLIIEDGAIVDMQEETNIIIKPSGKLIINNATITSSNYWQGIEVWGNRQAHQWPDAEGNYAQGYLELNNATIENAINAVSLWKPGSYSTTGGIIIAKNTAFRNNKRSVHALRYTNFHPHPDNNKEMDYRASFTRCTFEINENYPGVERFYKHIDLDRVNGVKFLACDFSLSPAPNVSSNNMAIGSYSAGFSARGICTLHDQYTCVEYDPITFTGFYRAVNANNNDLSTRTFYVNLAQFDNNTYGIRTFGINNFVVLNSEFIIGYNEPESDPCDDEGKSASGFGIHMTGCTGFAIEENKFTKTIGAPLGNYTGILCKDSRTEHDIIYRNTFIGLSYGNFAEGVNRFSDEQHSGLEYQCNTNIRNKRDFIVTGEDFPQIRSFQGTQDKEAGNIFSIGVELPDGHFKNTGTQVINYFYKNNPPLHYTPEVVVPTIIISENNCPSHYGGGSGGGSTEGVVLSSDEKQQAESEFANNLSDFNSVKALFDDLKDGGNTQALTIEVETAWPSDMWDLRAELLGKSPHLSQEVLMAAADKTDVLPESILFEILSANPDELRKEELISHLENKNQPLPAYMISILRQLAGGITYKTILQQDMARYQAGKTQAAYDLIRSCLNDTVSDYTYLRTWLNNLDNLNADRQIVSAYLAEENYIAAQSMLNLIPATRNLEGNALAGFNDYKTIMQMQMAWQQQNRSIFELDSLEVDMLVDFAENASGNAAMMAKGILEYAYGHHYCNCLPVDDPAAWKSSAVMPGAGVAGHGLFIQAVPNPASTWVAFNFRLPVHVNEAVLQITDVHGRSITSFVLTANHGQQIWDIRDVKKGVYLYNLKAGTMSKNGKLIIN